MRFEKFFLNFGYCFFVIEPSPTSKAIEAICKGKVDSRCSSVDKQCVLIASMLI